MLRNNYARNNSEKEKAKHELQLEWSLENESKHAVGAFYRTGSIEVF